MTPRGLIKLTAIANNIEAWKDWERDAEAARAAGFGDVVEVFQPTPGSTWRMVDRRRTALAKSIAERQAIQAS